MDRPHTAVACLQASQHTHTLKTIKNKSKDTPAKQSKDNQKEITTQSKDNRQELKCNQRPVKDFQKTIE